jgi:hypothetical protein
LLVSFLIGLLMLALYVAVPYAWYRSHRQLRAKGYRAWLIATVFVTLLFVSLAIGGSLGNDNDAVVLVPPAVWLAGALGFTAVLPWRKGAVRDGRLVQVGERRAGKRRAVGAATWGWVFTIGGGLMTLFFSWQLISPTIVPRDQGWKALLAALSVMVLLGQHFFDIVRRSKAAPETLPATTATVLYLRSFDEETRPFVFGPRSILKKYTSQLAAHAPFQRGDPTLALTLEDYLEEAITAQIGPFVGLGNPYDTMAPDGAIREYAPDDRWQSRFHELVRHAKCIVLSVGGSANLEWELQQIKDQGLGPRLCVFTSPVVPGTDRKFLNRLRKTASKRSQAIADEWTTSSEVLRRVGFNCAANPGPGAAISFDAQGNSTIITTDAHWPLDFITPVADWFNEGKKSGRCVPVKCRSCASDTHVTEAAAATGGECDDCREKQELARNPFFNRHPVITGAWAVAALVIAAAAATAIQVTSMWLVIPLWIAVVVLPIALNSMWRARWHSTE